MDRRSKSDPIGTHRVLNNVPLKSFGSPKHVAALSWFLLSEQSHFTTGSIYKTDGGQSLSSNPF